MRQPKITIEDFLSNTTRVGNCLLWKGSCDKDGYPKHTAYGRDNGKPRGQHTVRVNIRVLELKLGRSLCDGMQSNHTCDHSSCINPDHLYEGTQKQNRADCVRRGRTNSSGPKGEAAFTAKLKEEDIPVVLKMAQQGTSARGIARHFGLGSHKTVTRILDGSGWRHIQRCAVL